MIFLTGPRQAGKTTLAEIISRSFANSLYFNWDIPQNRIRLIENPAFFEAVERKNTSISVWSATMNSEKYGRGYPS
ncbi:MAG: AAA family ATPase [Deltaproteobacteria bacterium]|nr:AAA family ATPase [Deltaproteobacteria bacterium]